MTSNYLKLDSFGNKVPHVLNIEIPSAGLKYMGKDTYSGQSANFCSFTP